MAPRRTARALRGVACAVAVSAWLVIASAYPVSGSNFGSNITHPCDTSTASQCIANNGNHAHYVGSLEANQKTAQRYACDSVYDPVADITCVEYISSSNTDAYGLDGLYYTAYWGWTQCSQSATYGGTDPYRWCRPQFIKYDLSQTTFFSSSFNRRYLACQEFGHTLGLRHRSSTDTCMYPNRVTVDVLGSHEKTVLSYYYGGPQQQPVSTEP